MFSPLTMLLVVCCYMALLFALAQWVERRIEKNQYDTNKPWLYALSMAVFFTSWTFYGSVGFASRNGPLYLGIYIGALLGCLIFWLTLRRMVLAKETFRITSIADFIATRYNRSPWIAALVTLIAVFGVLPYIALQLTAIVSSVQILTAQEHGAETWGVHGLLVTAIMIAFTIIIGMRRLDPTERHQGMISALVAECLIKLFAALTVGAFITWWMFDGIGDITQQIRSNNLDHLMTFNIEGGTGALWLTLIVLGFVGVQLMPRQFHVSVVENADQGHLKTSFWLFPLYMVLINLFVIPIAAAGMLSDIPSQSADYFVLLLPQQAGADLITLIGFIGGFSAATGMILITTLTLATMVSNHLVLPVIERINTLNEMRHKLLQLRWISAALILVGSYIFALEFSDSYILVAIGLLSFTAILQFAPAALLGMFWRRGNSMGAMLGLLLGIAIWAYTQLIPTFVRQGWIDPTLLEEGLWGLQLLRPEALFGFEGLPTVAHTTLWSLIFNLAGYILGTLLFKPDKGERTLTNEFICAMEANRSASRARPLGLDAYIELTPKLEEAENLLADYLSHQKASSAITTILEDLQVNDKQAITIIELIEFHRMLEHLLAGSIGSASAHRAIENGICYSKRESSDLKALYSHIVSDLRTEESRQSETNEKEAQDNFNLLQELQNKLNNLQTTARDQEEKIAGLEQRLETSYEESFRYRLEAQRLKQENQDLKTQLSQRYQQSSE